MVNVRSSANEVTAERIRALGATAAELRDALRSLRFPLEVGGSTTLDAAAAQRESYAMVQQFDDHVLARIEHLDAPALVVVGGSTGSGKSLLVNSLVGADVTRPGVLRPTTMAPSLIHEPSSAEWFGSTKILPGLARVFGGDAHGHHEIRLVPQESMPEGVALIDSPDIDSVSSENRALAAELLAAADLWIFVTTAARYADAVPWDFLLRARAQGTPLIIVMNRVPQGSEDTLRAHLAEMLAERGLGGTEIFTIAEQTLDGTRLPVDAVRGVRAWLEALGADESARVNAVRRSLEGSLADLCNRSDRVADAVEAQVGAVDNLQTLARAPYEAAFNQIREDIGKGALLKGEVLSRWEELLGTGELFRQLRTGVARIRDKVTGVITARPKRDIPLNGAVEHVVETLIRTRADEAASKAVAAWRTNPAGASLLTNVETGQRSDDGLDRSSPDLAARTATSVRDWQRHLLELIRNVGGNRKTKARVLSFGVNGVAAVVMMLVFAHTGGLTGAEVAVAGGASAVGHSLLEAVLGDQTVRNLALAARSDLEARVRALLDHEADRFDERLADAGIDSDAPSRLRALATKLRNGLK